MKAAVRLGLFALLVGVVPSAAAEKALGWSDTAEFSLVVARGNSESESLGLRNLLRRAWPEANFEFEVSAIRSASTDVTTLAVGPGAGDFVVIEEKDEDVDTELYSIGLSYDRKFSERSYWKIGAGWLQNRPAEIQSRTSLAAGLGTHWVDTDTTQFKTEYGLTFTREEFTSRGLETDEYAGFRFLMAWDQKLNDSTTYSQKLILDENLDDTNDLRADWVNSLAVAINERLALKVSLQLLYDNEPALEELELEFPRGTPTGILILNPVDDLDTLFTSSLVVKF